MKKYLKFMFLAAALILAAGCSKEAEVEFNSGKLLLTKQETVGGEVILFEYDSKNRLTRTRHGSELTTEYQYAGNGNLSVILFKDEKGETFSREEYTYDSNKKPTTAVITSPLLPDENPIDVTFSHSANKVLITYKYRENPDENVITNESAFDNLGNLISTVIKSDGEVINDMVWSDFDSKPSPNFHGNPKPWLIQKNNPGRFISTSFGVTTDNTFEYQYNKEGYPTKVVSYETGSSTVHETYLNTYKVAK